MSASGYIYADTLTWYAKGPESNRQATYTAVELPCQWEPRHGAYRTTRGDLSEYTLEALVQQLGIKQGDKVAKGDDVYTVVYVDDIYMRGHYHHSEVYAK